jgi:hypothetical protein
MTRKTSARDALVARRAAFRQPSSLVPGLKAAASLARVALARTRPSSANSCSSRPRWPPSCPTSPGGWPRFPDSRRWPPPPRRRSSALGGPRLLFAGPEPPPARQGGGGRARCRRRPPDGRASGRRPLHRGGGREHRLRRAARLRRRQRGPDPLPPHPRRHPLRDSASASKAFAPLAQELVHPAAPRRPQPGDDGARRDRVQEAPPPAVTRGLSSMTKRCSRGARTGSPSRSRPRPIRSPGGRALWNPRRGGGTRAAGPHSPQAAPGG